jgi:ferric-dicitrate binding protein FerR (iron transport regulator)
LTDKDYQDFNTEDFLMDNSFLSYCLGEDKTHVKFWEEWIEAHKEKYTEVSRARELYFILNGKNDQAQFDNDEKDFRAAFEKHISANQDGGSGIVFPGKKNYPLKTMWFYAGAAAACIAIAVLLFVIQRPDQKQDKQQALLSDRIETSKPGEKKTLLLPDGSKVTLNAGSTFTILKNFNERLREVTLEGEAYFEIERNPQKPFIIHTVSMNIKVLGTIFNVKAYPTDKTLETSLLKGSVEVTLKNENFRKVILHPDEKIVLINPLFRNESQTHNTLKEEAKKEKHTIANLTYDADSSRLEVSWIEDRLAFNDNSFEEVATELGRWYNVSVQFEDDIVKQYRFTAIFDHKTIREVLNALQLSRYFNYTIENGNEITIRQ